MKPLPHPAASGIAAVAERVADGRDRVLAEIRKVIVGQDAVIDEVLTALFTGGHCLITGVPGLAKTLLIKTVARILDLSFKRIQFTPDLMPADITGTEVLDEEGGHRSLRFVKGPIFAQIILADEINRTPPKTQAALLEAMQEYHVTAAGRTYALERPFFVLATQNPIELEGTYPLPEAQLVRQVVVAEDVARYAVRLVDASRPGRGDDHKFIREWVKWGAGLRASQSLILAGKARALMHGRYHVSVADIQALARPVLRHRIIPNFYAESERITPDNLIERLIEAVPPPRSGM